MQRSYCQSLLVYLNLDEVIRIIREEDDAKGALKKTFKLTDMQVDYILDTRLRALRKLEEMELRRELQELSEERTDIDDLLANEDRQWKVIAAQVRELKKTYGPQTAAGKRRTTFEDAPESVNLDLAEAMIAREPITVVLSKMGWIRALKGHVQDLSSLAFKGDDALDAAFFAQTTTKILAFATNGKVYTLLGANLPGGRGMGEPVRLMIDLPNEASGIIASTESRTRPTSISRPGTPSTARAIRNPNSASATSARPRPASRTSAPSPVTTAARASSSASSSNPKPTPSRSWSN